MSGRKKPDDGGHEPGDGFRKAFQAMSRAGRIIAGSLKKWVRKKVEKGPTLEPIGLQSLPLPIRHSDFSFTIRELITERTTKQCPVCLAYVGRDTQNRQVDWIGPPGRTAYSVVVGSEHAWVCKVCGCWKASYQTDTFVWYETVLYKTWRWCAWGSVDTSHDSVVFEPESKEEKASREADVNDHVKEMVRIREEYPDWLFHKEYIKDTFAGAAGNQVTALNTFLDWLEERDFPLTAKAVRDLIAHYGQNPGAL